MSLSLNGGSTFNIEKGANHLQSAYATIAQIKQLGDHSSAWLTSLTYNRSEAESC